MRATLEVIAPTHGEALAKAREAFDLFFGTRDAWVFDGTTAVPELYIMGQEVPASWRCEFNALGPKR